jgi:hypothetical protein
MTIQAKREPLEFLHLDSVGAVINTYSTLYGMGYRGTLDTVGDVTAAINMALPNHVPISAAVGDVILYRTAPAIEVVDTVTFNELIERYEAVA